MESVKTDEVALTRVCEGASAVYVDEAEAAGVPQWYLRTPRWSSSCRLQSCARANAFSHPSYEHAYGFSLRCAR